MFKSKMVLDKNSLRTLYCSLFLPYFNYCSEIGEIPTKQI